uniref:hypothetical protein n=1 Tax=Agathobacter sp. TaxID=2021311 RepID=UPI004055B650
MIKRKTSFETDKNNNPHREYKAGSLAVCLVFLSKIVNKTVWDKLTHVVPYMVVVR